MDLLDKLKMFRDELNLLIEAEEKKRAQQSEVGKTFTQRIHERMVLKSDSFEDEIGTTIGCHEVLSKITNEL